MVRKHRQPQRTCIGCRTVRPKKELVRIVRTPEGEVVVDPTGRKSGRGAYICPAVACLDKALAGNRIDRALHMTIPDEVIDSLRVQLNTQLDE